ncbi:tRNA (guanosine(37)-N1)-methyltransferase TrmD [Candidatus Roizmanbacteria bacterium RIFCSPHIGHO2_02_FULL_40_13b]|uniref:tRNA (guanine-N(1)-)-methyltransferase n=1 Tax=Candidatus Roizmanbacteria bacterium RIFCSPHIGHO2_01_FULL_39_24 TaxID=1802032 RepID=A0A1F7GL56_9BACT|nr:MAG: tRNA (guanosine(37)-N1)-methyltransferase TrmD [Candidatus Roizmanbacteria bacterium RIFCSPHIGHO2_01_FULL_39_24]OGK27978.1 MAG: tRNA (guanosine(37)-N1)-methyltransferase TrmD [Candidatus Roizmanbacteria bacterium RIFCSPHIGHO2_02_FULL_40_13b]OGK49230.1 MAG: tRNA (guanosine(37)-N1)-methyltransferase TrmD [Candidatus Roizmanbacteria bacterium RIFCSPLOWO2_01_FULL_40_32]OGK57200.1 MAG: tRNA (guanosine(37)-N1)-methyltransferase TrmD [Candidatus Roizmanbacteria bacterium RIFCSPLOWO2_02_FULL_39_
MKITVITLFPDMINALLGESIIARAVKNKQIELEVVNLRDFSNNEYGSVDDRPYGGGAGMVLRVDCLTDAIKSIPLPGKILLTSAKGAIYSQKKAVEFSQLPSLTIIAGHYEGVDERVLDYIDEEISIGDFVMTGGEIAACAIIDSVVRLIPNVLKKEEATEEESFFEVQLDELMNAVPNDEELVRLKNEGTVSVQLLEYPHFTRPEEFDGKKVPEILLSGNHAQIRAWRITKAFEITKARRPDLLVNTV